MSGVFDQDQDKKKKKLNPIVAVTSFTFKLIASGAFLIWVSWWGYSHVMKFVLGRFDLFDTQSIQSVVFGKARVLVLNPVRTEEYLRGDPEDTIWPWRERNDPWKLADTLWYAAGMQYKGEKLESWDLISNVSQKEVGLTEYWADILLDSRISFKNIEEPDLTNIPPDYNILIVPGALLLSKAERQAIKDFVADGGALFCTWLMGCRDENGKWLGHQFLSQITGGLTSHSVEDVSGGTSFILRGRSPITAMVAPGKHLEFYTYNGYITLNLVEPRATSDAFWFSPYWNDYTNYASSSDCIIAHGKYVEGKFVWFGFSPASVQEHKDNNEILTKLIVNALGWLHGDPVVNARVWPGGYRAGGSLLLEARGSGNPVQAVVGRAIDRDVTLDLIIDDKFSPGSVSLKDISRGDLILTANLLDSVLYPEMKDQLKWMKDNSKRLASLTNKEPIGFFPVDWKPSKETLKAAARSDFSLVFSEPDPRDYGPKVTLVKQGFWWLLTGRTRMATCPKSQLSVWEWNKLKGVKGRGQLLNAMTGDLSRIRKAGGLYFGIFDPAVLVSNNAIDLPSRMAAYMDSMGVWRTSTQKVVERYTGWHGLRVSNLEITSTRYRLELSNEGKVDLTNVIYDVYLPPGRFLDVELTTQRMGFSATKLNWNRRTGVCSFVISKIGPRDNHAVFIDLITQEMLDREKLVKE
ncbi:MAG: beta-galactosidase trimerization domain-containing protein [Candidatus Hatepunaea meridiana]|nr:beta-galactosidase trimerization domain-containing protein [Candidatus Hatepunaea meridiana]